MNKKRLIQCGVTIALLTSCSSIKVITAERDLKHAEFSKQYQAAVASPAPFVAKRSCRLISKLNEWTSISFTQSTPVVTLPSGTAAASICLTIPVGAHAVEVQTGAVDFMIIHPSLQFLDDQYALLKDIPKLPLSSEDPFQGRFRLDVNTELSSDLANAAQVVVYVHPSSLMGEAKVRVHYDVYRILYTPYGRVDIKFH